MQTNRQLIKDVFENTPHLDDLDWKPFRDGISIFRLYGNQENGPAAALLRYDAGTWLPEHEHAGYEHIFVLRGVQSDERGEYPAGTMITNGPGTTHTVRNAAGSIVLVMWEKPVRFLES